MESVSWKLPDGSESEMKEFCGTLLVNGTINMGGHDASGYLMGGGAGGSILIETMKMVGFGSLLASGGDSALGGGGGGGRVAIHCLTCEDDSAKDTLSSLSVLGGISSHQDFGPGGPGTLYETWHSNGGNQMNKLTLDHNRRSIESVSSTQLLHKSGIIDIGIIVLLGGAELTIVSDNIAEERPVLMTFKKLDGDGTGLFSLDRFATVTPLVESPWILTGKVQVLEGGELKFGYGMDLQLRGISSLSVLGRFTFKNNHAPTITTINGTCDFLAGSRAQSETELASAQTGAYEEWTHHFKAINILGGRVTLPGSGRVFVENLVDVVFWGVLRVEDGLELSVQSLTCGTTGSSLITTIEWYGFAKLKVSDTITLRDSCIVNGKANGYSELSGPWGLSSEQSKLTVDLNGCGATHAGIGGGINPNDADGVSEMHKYLGDIAGYGHYQETTSMGAGSAGASGGAAIYLEARIIVVDGIITADGGDASSTNLGGAAGGSIWLKATIETSTKYTDEYQQNQYYGGSIQGSGILSARGGDGLNGGGGGRISLMTGSEDFFEGKTLVHGGASEINGIPGGGGTISYTKLQYYQYCTSNNIESCSYIQHPYAPSTIIVDNGGLNCNLRTHIFDGYSTSLVLAEVHARGYARLTFGTRSTLQVKLEVTVNIFLGDTSNMYFTTRSRIFILSTMVLTLRGADTSSPAVEKIVVMTMLSETVSLVTEQRLFYLADVALDGIDFESYGTVTFPNKVNIVRSSVNIQGTCRGFQFINIAYYGFLIFHNDASTGGAPPNNFEFNTLNIRDGGTLEFPVGATIYAYHVSIGNEGLENSKIIVKGDVKFFVDFEFVVTERGFVDGTGIVESPNGADILISSCLGTVVNDNSICIKVDGRIDVTTVIVGGLPGEIELNSTLVKGSGTLSASKVNIRARNVSVGFVFEPETCIFDTEAAFMPPAKKAYECSCDDLEAKETTLGICQETVEEKEKEIARLTNVEVYRWKLKYGDQKEQKEACLIKYGVLQRELPVQYFLTNNEWPPMGGGGGGECEHVVKIGNFAWERAIIISKNSNQRLQSWSSPMSLVPTTVHITFQMHLYFSFIFLNSLNMNVQNWEMTTLAFQNNFLLQQYNIILNTHFTTLISEKGVSTMPEFKFSPGSLTDTTKIVNGTTALIGKSVITPIVCGIPNIHSDQADILVHELRNRFHNGGGNFTDTMAMNENMTNNIILFKPQYNFVRHKYSLAIELTGIIYQEYTISIYLDFGVPSNTSHLTEESIKKSLEEYYAQENPTNVDRIEVVHRISGSILVSSWTATLYTYNFNFQSMFMKENKDNTCTQLKQSFQMNDAYFVNATRKNGDTTFSDTNCAEPLATNTKTYGQHIEYRRDLLQRLISNETSSFCNLNTGCMIEVVNDFSTEVFTKAVTGKSFSSQFICTMSIWNSVLDIDNYSPFTGLNPVTILANLQKANKANIEMNALYSKTFDEIRIRIPIRAVFKFRYSRQVSGTISRLYQLRDALSIMISNHVKSCSVLGSCVTHVVPLGLSTNTWTKSNSFSKSNNTAFILTDPLTAYTTFSVQMWALSCTSCAERDQARTVYELFQNISSGHYRDEITKLLLNNMAIRNSEYKYEVSTFEILKSSAVAIGHVQVVEQRKHEIVAGISHRTSSVSFDYHIRMLLSKEFHFVFNTSIANGNLASHINRTSIIAAVTSHFVDDIVENEFNEFVAATLIDGSTVSNEYAEYVTWSCTVFTNNPLIQTGTLESHLRQTFGLGLMNIKTTNTNFNSLPIKLVKQYSEIQFKLRNIFQDAIRGELCRVDQIVMNQDCPNSISKSDISIFIEKTPQLNQNELDAWLLQRRRLTVVVKASNSWIANILRDVIIAPRFGQIIDENIYANLTGTKLYQIGETNCSWAKRPELTDQINVGCRHRARISIYVSRTKGWTNALNDRWNIRQSLLDNVCRQESNRVSCVIEIFNVKTNLKTLKIVVSVSSLQAEEQARLLVNNDEVCNSWLRSIANMDSTTVCARNSNGEEHLLKNEVHVVNLLPVAEIIEVSWHPSQKNDKGGGFKTRMKESDFRFACTSENEYDICMFAYRIIPYDDTIGLGLGITNLTNNTANVTSEERPWLYVNASRLHIEDTGSRQAEIVFDACLFGAVDGTNENYPCTPALGTGKYRLEVLASLTDDPEYEQYRSEPTVFDWEIIPDVTTLSQDAKEDLLVDLAGSLVMNPTGDVMKLAEAQEATAILCNQAGTGAPKFIQPNISRTVSSIVDGKKIGKLELEPFTLKVAPYKERVPNTPYIVGRRWRYDKTTEIKFKPGDFLQYAREEGQVINKDAKNSTMTVQYQYQEPNNPNCEWIDCTYHSKFTSVCNYDYRTKSLVMYPNNEGHMKADGSHTIAVRVNKTFTQGGAKGLSIQTPFLAVKEQLVKWIVDRTLPKMEYTIDCTKRLCSKGELCQTCEDMISPKTTFIRGGDKKDDDTMILDINIRNYIDRDLLDIKNPGNIEIRLDSGKINKDGSRDASEFSKSPWLSLKKPPHENENVFTDITNPFGQEHDNAANVKCRIPSIKIRQGTGHMFSIEIPPDYATDKLDTFQRWLEIRATDEALNSFYIAFDWWQTSNLNDPNPKTPGMISYEYIDECRVQIQWKSAKSLQNVSKVEVLPLGNPASVEHVLWWSHKHAKEMMLLQTKDVMRLREKKNGLHTLTGERWVEWQNNNTAKYDVKKVEWGAVNGNLWSAKFKMATDTVFNITLEKPTYDDRTYFGVSAVAFASGYTPKTQTSIAGWTIAEDCRDSAYYLDVSGNISCPLLERGDGSLRPDMGCELGKWQCRECVDGANCRGAVVWPNVGVRDGWWRSNWNNSVFLPCGEEAACVGVEGDDASKRYCNGTRPPPMGTCNEAAGYTKMCSETFITLLRPDFRDTPVPELKQCNLCTRCMQNGTHNYGRSFGSTTKCEICWDPVEHALNASLLILIFCATIGWYIRANRKTGYRSNAALMKRAISLAGKADGVFIETMDERAKYKLAMVATMNKCIILLCYSGSLSIPWHPAVKGLFVVYKAMSTFVGDYVRLDCLPQFAYEEIFPFVFKDALFWVITFPCVLALFTLLALLFSKTKKSSKINAVAAVMATIETLYPT
jgi:hypothetical protein